MDANKSRYPKHACQHCGSEVKLVETIIDDEFIWDENAKKYIPNQFSDQFEHTGVERCASCNKDWSGARERVWVNLAFSPQSHSTLATANVL